MPTDSRIEQFDSPKEGRTSDNQFHAERTWVCNWADRYYVRGLILDWPGEMYPYQPLFEAYARECTIEPLPRSAPDGGTDSYGLRTFNKALIRATYESNRPGLPFVDKTHPDEIVSETWEPSVEFLTMDPKLARWKTPWKETIETGVDANGNVTTRTQKTQRVTPDQTPGYQLQGGNYVYTRHNLASVPEEVFTLAGTCNAKQLSVRSFPLTFAPQTLLFLPALVRATVMNDGSQRYGVELRFQWRNIPSWNKFWRPDLYNGQADSVWDTLQVRSVNGDWFDFEMYPPEDWDIVFK